MSYPGNNGFSIANDELKTFQSVAVERFLNDADDYGDLYGTQHTTKRKDRRQRTKWYLRPILSPFFQLPEAHQKEPYYTTVDEVVSWLEEADVFLEDFDYSAWRKRYRPRKKNKPGRIPLFEGLDEVRSE